MHQDVCLSQDGCRQEVLSLMGWPFSGNHRMDLARFHHPGQYLKLASVWLEIVVVVLFSPGGIHSSPQLPVTPSGGSDFCSFGGILNSCVQIHTNILKDHKQIIKKKEFLLPQPQILKKLKDSSEKNKTTFHNGKATFHHDMTEGAWSET